MTRLYRSPAFRGVLHAAAIGLAVIGITALFLTWALNHENPPPCYEIECFEGDTTHE